MDLAIAVLALILALPAMIVIAAAIGLTTRGSPVFFHKRIGYRGRIFSCYKFRTMVHDADAALAKLLANDPAAAAEWAKRQKLRHDPRVTRLGRLLRKCSLDELPQLINVLRGDMSCVGPRPVTPKELERYGTAADAYLSARPGITGLWQVAGRSSTDFAARVALDERYVLGWSLFGDVAILARTPAAVLRITQTD
jgi:exopolysaccharide production protein ExoY